MDSFPSNQWHEEGYLSCIAESIVLAGVVAALAPNENMYMGGGGSGGCGADAGDEVGGVGQKIIMAVRNIIHTNAHSKCQFAKSIT